MKSIPRHRHAVSFIEDVHATLLCADVAQPLLHKEPCLRYTVRSPSLHPSPASAAQEAKNEIGYAHSGVSVYSRTPSAACAGVLICHIRAVRSHVFKDGAKSYI